MPATAANTATRATASSGLNIGSLIGRHRQHMLCRLSRLAAKPQFSRSLKENCNQRPLAAIEQATDEALANGSANEAVPAAMLVNADLPEWCLIWPGL